MNKTAPNFLSHRRGNRLVLPFAIVIFIGKCREILQDKLVNDALNADVALEQGNFARLDFNYAGKQ